ncbi:MAG: ParB/RepB/Spo0J family partition protein [Pseudomonadales bacterium]
MSKKRLGRGLDALLSDSRATSAQESSAADATTETSDASVDAGAPAAATVASSDGATVAATVAVDAVQPSPYQPRRYFDEEALADLSQSIKHSGLLQPIVVRQKATGGYELIAGERRLRAARMAGLTELPAIVRSVTDEEASAFALIENIQREDLGALEEAQGLARLRDEFELTQQQIADAVGKSRVAIANLLRLLNLGRIAKDMLAAGDLEMGHARALLGLTGVEQDRAAHKVVEERLSVRQAEELVRRMLAGDAPRPAKTQNNNDADTQRLEQQLSDQLGAPVSIKQSAGGKGEVIIKYTTLEELDGVLHHFGLSEQKS